MIRFTALGDVDLRTDDGVVLGSVLSQTRRLALLTYLAVESARGGVQRDRLIATFWPDLPSDPGRNALRTALHFLRRSLGAEAFGTHGPWITLNPAVVRSDAAEFRSLLEKGDADGALRLYRGELLPGFHLEGGPVEFEHWLDRTRETLRRSAAEAAWSLAATEYDRGNPAGAGSWARRASLLYHGDEVAARRSIELLGRIGDRAGALEVYESLARHLRDEFDAEPSERTRAAIAALRDGGDAALPEGPDARTAELAEVTKSARPVASADAAPGKAVPGSTPARQVRRLARGAYSAGVTVVLAFAFYSLWGTDRVGPVAPADDRGPLIHIEELRDFSSDRSTANLAGALTMELTGRLSESAALRVVPVMRRDAPSVDSRDRATYLVRGGVLRSDSMLRITAILVDGASGATLDRVGLEREASGIDVDEVAETMARRIRRQVGRAVDDHERGATSRNPTSLALVRAAVRDIEVGDSVAAAGVTEAARAAFEAADSVLELAQTAAPRWAEPSVLRAEVAYRQMWLELLPPTGESQRIARTLYPGVQHADAALAIAPNDPSALELRGVLQYWLWLTRSAGSDVEDREALRRAEADLRRATDLDAGRGRAWTTLSAILERRADFAAANLAAGRAYRADPYLRNASETLLRLFVTSLEVGDPVSARHWCDELGRRMHGLWLPGYCMLMQLAWYGPPDGMDADSLEAAVHSTVNAVPAPASLRARLHMLGAVALAQVGSPAATAMIETAISASGGDPDVVVLEAWARLVLGDHDAAVALLAKAAGQDPRGAPSMLQSRRFDALRGDSRLRSLVLARTR